MAYDPTSRLQSPLICLEGVPSSRALLALLMSEEPYGLKAPDRLEADVGDCRDLSTVQLYAGPEL